MEYDVRRLSTVKSADGLSAVENFHAWFGEGGVRGDRGMPLILFHGTPAPDRLISFVPGGVPGSTLSGDAFGVASYFTTSPNEASYYAGPGGATMPVLIRGKFLDLTSPLTIADSVRLSTFADGLLTHADRARFADGRQRKLFKEVQDARDFFDFQREQFLVYGEGMCRAKPEVFLVGEEFGVEFTDYDAKIEIRATDDAETLFRAVGWDNLSSAGFDGVILQRANGEKWVVVHNIYGNIKSAIGNNGLFDERCNDLTDMTSLLCARAVRNAERALEIIGDFGQLQRRLNVR